MARGDSRQRERAEEMRDEERGGIEGEQSKASTEKIKPPSTSLFETTLAQRAYTHNAPRKDGDDVVRKPAAQVVATNGCRRHHEQAIVIKGDEKVQDDVDEEDALFCCFGLVFLCGCDGGGGVFFLRAT